jgi:hypothetical protein
MWLLPIPLIRDFQVRLEKLQKEVHRVQLCDRRFLDKGWHVGGQNRACGASHMMRYCGDEAGSRGISITVLERVRPEVG